VHAWPRPRCARSYKRLCSSAEPRSLAHWQGCATRQLRRGMVNETLCNLSLPVVKQIQEGTGDAQLPSQVIGASIWLRRVPWRISRWKMARSRIQARASLGLGRLCRRTWPQCGRTVSPVARALAPCFRVFVLCKRLGHWINRVPGAHQGDSLCIPFTLTLTLAIPSYL